MELSLACLKTSMPHHLVLHVLGVQHTPPRHIPREIKKTLEWPVTPIQPHGLQECSSPMPQCKGKGGRVSDVAQGND
eukprot:12832283-Ditylum_brightwellii.AAC.1